MNKVILIGVNNFNLLGAVRTFGVNGIKPYGIVIGDKKGFVEHSKYWEKVTRICDPKDIISVLMNNFENEEEKPVVITCTDLSAKIVDENLIKLQDKFITSSFLNKEGKLVKWMDKFEQTKLADKIGYSMLDSCVIDLTREEIEMPYQLPIIIKSVASVDGISSGTIVCAKENEWERVIEKEKKAGNPRVLVQRYLQNRTEYVLSGSVDALRNNISYTLLKNIRAYPIRIGTGCYSEYVTDDRMIEVANDIMHGVISTGYSGPIDVEFFEDETGRIYICEFNWRVSGRNFVALDNKVYSIYFWYLSVTDRKITESTINRKYGIAFTEDAEYYSMLNKVITKEEYKLAKKNATAFSLKYKKDMLPYILQKISLMKAGVIHKIGKLTWIRSVIKKIRVR